MKYYMTTKIFKFEFFNIIDFYFVVKYEYCYDIKLGFVQNDY